MVELDVEARESVSDPGMDDPNVCRRQANALIDERRFAEAEPWLRAAVRHFPDDAPLINRLGSSLWEQGRAVESQPYFEQAVAMRPNEPVFRNNLGLAHWDQGRPAEAADCYRVALALNPRAVDVRMNLGVVLSDLGHFEEALGYLLEAYRLDPTSPDALQNLGMTLGRLGRWPEALDYYDRALKIRPEYGEVHRNRAYGWLYVGDFERGWPEHEWRLRCRSHRGSRINRPRWNGEPLDGRSILLHAEQGFGDTLMFIRYARLVKERGGLVFVATQTQLLRIVARCAGVDMAFDGTAVVPDCELHAPLMSLPAILGTTQKTVPAKIPYLPTEPVVIERWRGLLGEALGYDPMSGCDLKGNRTSSRHDRPLLVGIAWQGSPNNPMDRFRSFPLAELAPVADVPGVRFVCIQAVDGLDQIPALNGRFPVLELQTSRPRDFRDTAALLSMMDLVITPDSAVAHLSGGLGVPVWLALSTVGEWRWMTDREDSPWYPSMRIFRQSRYAEWRPVFERMADTLRQSFRNPAASAA